MAEEAEPEEIQAPGFVEEDGHDLPIAPARPAIHDQLRAVLESAPVGPGHALVRDRISGNDRLCPMNPEDMGDTYLGAALMALFNISPFLNFLEDAVEKKAFDDPLIAALHGLAQRFRGWGEGVETEEQQQAEVQNHLKLVKYFTSFLHSDLPRPFKVTGAYGYEVPEFISYLFRRIERAPLRQDQAGGDDVDLSVRFKQLFRYFNVRYSPIRCMCVQPVLRRQDTAKSQPDGFLLNVQVPKSMTLAQAVSRAMWERLACGRICPECDHITEPVHDFDKFAYLPEVLIVNIAFLDISGGQGKYIHTFDEELIYPENLDMSAFRDDPQRPGDQADCIYNLKSIVHTNRNTPGAQKLMWKAALRLDEDEFAQFDYQSDPEIYPDPVTFEYLNEPSVGVPQLLVYVRDRDADAAGIPTDAVKAKSNEPQGGTTKAETSAPSQPGPQVRQPIVTSHASDHGTHNSKLQAFIDTQDSEILYSNKSHYHQAVTDLELGKKCDRWMWFMFPVVPNISQSWDQWLLSLEVLDVDAASNYEITTLDEARAYWKHPVLKERYINLVEIIRNGSETDLDHIFDSGDQENYRIREYVYTDNTWLTANCPHFLASLTLFSFICRDEKYNSRLFEGVFKKFNRLMDLPTLYQLARWAKDEGDEEGIDTIRDWIKSNSGSTYCRGNNVGPSFDYGFSPRKNKVPNISHDPAQKIGSRLLSLADEDFSGDNSKDGDNDAAILNQWACDIGKVILSFGLPNTIAVPALELNTPEAEERARRLGRHILSLADNYYTPDDTKKDTKKDTNDTSARYNSLNEAVGNLNLGLDGASDEPDGGADQSDDDLYEAVAIPTDPHDPRIEACENWTLDELKREFQKEQLDWRGLRADPQKHRMKFRKHFELERDYSIYHEVRLRQAIEDRGIRLRHGGKVDKAELVDALTEYDSQKLQGAGYLDGDESETTESDVYESEPYQSSEASGNEAWYVERERAALAADGKQGPTTAQPRAVAAAARARKRPRDEDEDDFYYDDEDEDDDELLPRAPAKGPVRMRTRY